VRVSHSRGNCLVTEKPLRGADVHPGHDEAASKCVSQAVPAKICDLRILENRLEPTPRLSGTPKTCSEASEPLTESFERLDGPLFWHRAGIFGGARSGVNARSVVVGIESFFRGGRLRRRSR
jgi:hypothetical protein